MTLTDEELLSIFPDAAQRDVVDQNTGDVTGQQVMLDGIRAVGSRLIDILSAAFALDVFPGAHWLYHLKGMDREDGDQQEIELPDSAIVLVPARISQSAYGADNDDNWFQLGTHDSGSGRILRFGQRSTVDLVFDVYITRDSVLDTMEDQWLWENLWKTYQFLDVGTVLDEDTQEIIRDGIAYRTRNVLSMSDQNVLNYSSIVLAKGSVEIQGVVLVDPAIVEEAGTLISDPKIQVNAGSLPNC